MIKKITAFLLLSFCLCLSNGLADSSESPGQSDYDKAAAFFQQEQYDSAIEYFQKSLDVIKGPAQQARIYNLIGLAYLKQGISNSSAVGSFEQAIKLDPQFAEAYFNIASAYAGNPADAAKASEYFQKTIDVDPHYFKAYFGLGWFTLMQKDDPSNAIDYFQKTLDQYPGFAEAHYGMGLAYIRTHRSHMALGSVSQLRELKRDDLAAVLEKAISEVAPPPVEKVQSPAVTESGEEAAKPAAKVSGKGHSPFEMVMRGKLMPPKESAKS